MLYEEFIKLSGLNETLIDPDYYEKHIEPVYMDGDLDKQLFCQLCKTPALDAMLRVLQENNEMRKRKVHELAVYEKLESDLKEAKRQLDTCELNQGTMKLVEYRRCLKRRYRQLVMMKRYYGMNNLAPECTFRDVPGGWKEEFAE